MSDEIIEEIKARIDIVDLISEYIDLKRAGANYKGLCPFHSEKTPSFMVSPDKQIFHCFGCGKGGSIFNFIMEHDNLTFYESLKYLAQKAGVTLPSSQGNRSQSQKDKIFTIYQEAKDFYISKLSKSSKCLNYMKGRNISDETIKQFALGYALPDSDSLYKFLSSRKYDYEVIKKSNLVNISSNNKPYDFFRDRLMFPIHDLSGRCIAFGARTMSDRKDIPKYINSSDSMIFKKGEVFFALDIAKSTSQIKNYAIIVEGYMDALMCHQFGFHNAIAPLGTALTVQQINKLSRFTSNILFIFDGDTAGISAAMRSVPIALQSNLNAKIVVLPKNEDPDSLLRHSGVAVFKRFISSAISISHFMIKHASTDKLTAVKNAIEAISLCPDPIKQSDLIRELADISKINESAIWEQLSGIKKNKNRFLLSKKSHKSLLSDSLEISSEERLIFNIFFALPANAHFLIQQIDSSYFESDPAKSLYCKILDVLKSSDSQKDWIQHLLHQCDDAEKSVVSQLSLVGGITTENANEIFIDCVRKLQMKKIDRLYKIACKNGNLELIKKLLKTKQGILQK